MNSPQSGDHRLSIPEDPVVTLGFWLLGGAAGLAGIVWLTGGLAAYLTGGGWPHVTAGEMAGVLGRLPDHLSDPAQAWPASAREALPGPIPFFGVLGTLLVLAAAMGAGVARLRSSRRRRQAARWYERLAAHRSAPPPPGFDGAREARARGYGGPGLDVVPGPPRFLAGLVQGQPVWCPEQGNLLVVGPARSRKSSGVIAPNLRRWPGGLVVTSTRPEAYHWARAARAGNGRPFCVFDPAGLLNAPEAVTWFPWTGAERWDRAVSVAQALSGGLSDEGTANSRHFAELAGEWLAPVLHAAAIEGADLARVRSWVAGIDTAHLVGLLREHGSSVAAADLATLHALPDDEGKSAILANARRAVRWAARDDVRRELDPERHPLLDVEGLIADGGTLVVVSPPARMTELAPLMSALLTTLMERGQELAFCAPEDRLEIPFAFVLDEVPSIAPFPELPAHMATGGGYGMPTLAVAQDLAQLAERWGSERAQTMWDNASCRLVMPGALDERTDEAARRAAGEVLEIRQSGGASIGRSGPSGRGTASQSSRQESWRDDWSPAIRKGEIARLPVGEALGIAAGLRPLRLDLVDGR